MKAVIFNGSPRKDWNTEKALKRAMAGIVDSGIEAEEIQLYDYAYKGCVSCFACKRKNSRTNGLCAYQDVLRPVLEKAHEADIILVGSPVYYSYPTGQVRSFLERLLFPVGTYLWENGERIVIRDKVIPTGLIYTMNCSEDAMEELNYPVILSDTAKAMEQVMGHNELLYICDTYQFDDYSQYDMNLFDEEEKRKHRDEHFETDLEKAYQMGKNLAEKAKEIAANC